MSGDLQLTKPWPFLHLFRGVNVNVSLDFVFVMLEGYKISRFVNFEGDSGFSSCVRQI